MTYWLPGAKVVDLHPGIGNGPFADCYGVILHVNVDESGTPDSFWGNGNPNQVCPNFQVYKDGSIHQMLPLDWQPWCQIEGNFHYAAIETAGLPNEPLTDAQIVACGRIVAAYRSQLGVPLTLANSPGQRGLGTHEMGGSAWGGHPCPGTIRAGQRAAILAAASGTPVTTDPLEEIMAMYASRADFEAAMQRIVNAPTWNTGTGPHSPDTVIRSAVGDHVDGAVKLLVDIAPRVAAIQSSLASVTKTVGATATGLAAVTKAVAAIAAPTVTADVQSIVSGVSSAVSAKLNALTFKASA